MIIVPIAFSIISANCITRNKLTAHLKCDQGRKILITQKDLRSKHAQGTTQVAIQFEMRRAEWWARLNIPGLLATLKGENSREWRIPDPDRVKE